MNKKPNIAVVFNEPEYETKYSREINVVKTGNVSITDSSISAKNNFIDLIDLSEIGVIEEREQVEKALKDRGYNTFLFNINGNIKRLIEFFEQNKIDLVFNLCESLKREAINEMHVAGIYELMEVNYTGSASLSLGICLHKLLAKQILNSCGIPTPRHVMYMQAKEIKDCNLAINFPLIVKPSHEDASVGLNNSSVVLNIEELREQVEYISKTFEQPSLVEEYIDGRELNVAIMGNNNPIILPISEIDFSTLPAEYPKIVTYNAKWVEGSVEYKGTVGVCPAKLERSVEDKIKEIALKAYKVMEVRDYGRVDIRLGRNNIPYVLEVNPNPDISKDSGFARSARTAGLTYEDMIVKIVEIALERSR